MGKYKTKTAAKTKTKCKEEPTYAIFLKTREFKVIKYDQTKPDQSKMSRHLKCHEISNVMKSKMSRNLN